MSPKDCEAIAQIFFRVKSSFPPMRRGMREEELIRALASYMANEDRVFVRTEFIKMCNEGPLLKSEGLTP